MLARVDWPGKPGAGPAAAPLTAEEQQRFEAGRDVYQTLCSACHQPDGRGREQLAPRLVGSDSRSAAPGVAVRIVLNGKEGSAGLMPPLGSVLSDEQMAAALTYIRREWGHTRQRQSRRPTVDGDPRQSTTGRTRPWTVGGAQRNSESNG